MKKDKFKDFLINETQLLLSELVTLLNGKSEQDGFIFKVCSGSLMVSYMPANSSI
ncbi:hypothetical protein [Legionella quateirensis]|uniref:hypothetical protein n=1 Tax=Legionella quateirensis TaxID=45072 RepID=UPI000B3295EC|nr:hypothetical protein [Legionella quateirensis]